MEKSRTRILLSVICVLLLFCLTGCANRVEINDRSIVLGVVIDKPQAPEKSQKDEPQGSSESPEDDSQAGGEEEQDQNTVPEEAVEIPLPPEDQIPRYAMTIEAPLISQMGGVGGAGGGGAGEGGQSLVLTSTGNTLWEIERAMGLRVSRENFYGHLAVIVVGEDVARESLQPVLDFFTRRREVQQNIQVAIANGDSRKILQVIPQEEMFSGLYITDLLKSSFRTGSKINTDLLEFRRSMASSGNAVLPRIRATSPSEITIGGGAVIKDWKLRGWLSELETSGYNLVTNDLPGGGSLTVVDPKDKSELITSILRSFNVTRKVKMENGQPVFSVKMISEWDIVEKGSPVSLWDIHYVSQIEKRIESELQRRALTIIDKMQRDFKADIFGFGIMVSQQHPKYWKRVEQQWDDKYFPQVKVTVESSVKLRRSESKT